MPTDQNIIIVNINDIVVSKYQPRKFFEEESIKELALSIKTYGILNPLLVRKVNDKYELIAGERRYRAAKILGLQEIPVIVKNMGDNEVLELALIENIQRNNLNPIEEAESYKAILSNNNITQEELSAKIGKTQSSISNKMRLLNLNDTVKKAILEGKISERHGRILLKLEKEDQEKILQNIIEKKLTIKETEALVNQKTSKNNILDVLNSIDLENKDSNVFNDKEKEIIEKGEDSMNNNIGVGNFFPQINNENQAPISDNNTIMFNNNPVSTNIPDTNTVPLSVLSQEPPINNMTPPPIIQETPAPQIVPEVNTNVEVTPSISPIPSSEGPSLPPLMPDISLQNSSEPNNNNNMGLNINIEPTIPNVESVIPTIESPAPSVEVKPMTDPPLFNPNLSTAPLPSTVSLEPSVNIAIDTPNPEVPQVSSSLDKIKDMLSTLGDSKVTYKEYSNNEEKCIIISIKE